VGIHYKVKEQEPEVKGEEQKVAKETEKKKFPALGKILH
jgi:hypothetical protein